MGLRLVVILGIAKLSFVIVNACLIIQFIHDHKCREVYDESLKLNIQFIGIMNVEMNYMHILKYILLLTRAKCCLNLPWICCFSGCQIRLKLPNLCISCRPCKFQWPGCGCFKKISCQTCCNCLKNSCIPCSCCCFKKISCQTCCNCLKNSCLPCSCGCFKKISCQTCCNCLKNSCLPCSCCCFKRCSCKCRKENLCSGCPTYSCNPCNLCCCC